MLFGGIKAIVVDFSTSIMASIHILNFFPQSVDKTANTSSSRKAKTASIYDNPNNFRTVFIL